MRRLNIWIFSHERAQEFTKKKPIISEPFCALKHSLQSLFLSGIIAMRVANESLARILNI
jgi:hypothetical protein